MDLTPVEKFLLEDCSSSDDSDVESLLERHRQQMVVMVLAVHELEERKKKKRRGSTVSRLCIPRNRILGNEMLMRDYFYESPTYPPHLFRRRYRMRRSLFVKIVEACEANSRHFTHRRNVAGFLGFTAYQKDLRNNENDSIWCSWLLTLPCSCRSRSGLPSSRLALCRSLASCHMGGGC